MVVAIDTAGLWTERRRRVAELRRLEPRELQHGRVRGVHRRRPARAAGKVRGLELQRAAGRTCLRRDTHLREAAFAGEQLRGAQMCAQRGQGCVLASLAPQRQIRRQVEPPDPTL